MKKVNLRFLLASTLVVIIIGLTTLMAMKAENFWVNFSLNLLTEIIGAILVAVYLKSNISKEFADLTAQIKEEIENQREIQRINRAFFETEPEQAWNLVLDLKKRQLESKKAELAELKPNDTGRRIQLSKEVEILEKYIGTANSLSGKSPK